MYYYYYYYYYYTNDSVIVVADVEGEKPDVSHIFQVNSQTLTTVCQTNVYMTPAQVTPHFGSDAMDSQVLVSPAHLIGQFYTGCFFVVAHHIVSYRIVR